MFLRRVRRRRENLLSAAPLNCISMNNQVCQVRTQIVNVNGDDPVLFPFSVKTSKCSGSCNNINNPHAKLCVPGTVKFLNVRVFNLMSRTVINHVMLVNI